MNISIDRDFLHHTLVRLVEIDSINPALTSGGGGEGQIAAYVADTFRQLGLETHTQAIAADRFNVIGLRRGHGSGRSLMWNAHLDTVGVEGMPDPFAAGVREGRLYGRGAYDMKGGLAAMITAAKALLDAAIALGGDLMLAAVADEEFKSQGTEQLVRAYRTDAAIVTEPTDLAVCTAHRGFVWYRIETLGRAAHGSRYSEGIDANMHMGRVLRRLERLNQQLLSQPAHPLAGNPSLHAARIQGGTELSVYAARCTLEIERRTVPGEVIEEATAQLKTILEDLEAEDPRFRARLEALFSREPHEIAPDRPIVQAIERAAATVLGRPAQHMGQSFWTDAAILAQHGIDTVLMGPTGAGLHSAEEWVDLESVARLAEILARTASDYCR